MPPGHFRYLQAGSTCRRQALTLVELLVILFVLAAISWMVLAMTSQAISSRPLSPRLICASNLKGLGTSMKIYAHAEGGPFWTIPPFDEADARPFDYTKPVGRGSGTAAAPDRRQESISGPGGARELSATRSYWMLVRSGDTTVKQFVCPVSSDRPDETEEIDLYYDFESYDNISYGYQIPFGPPESRPHEGLDPRMPLAADKGPYRDASVATPPLNSPGTRNTPLDINDPSLWTPYNSPNHGGDGQNVLFADGHVEFVRTPVVGIDHDNIYTVAVDGSDPSCVTAGESPWVRHAPPLVRIDAATGKPACTDSVIFP